MKQILLFYLLIALPISCMAQGKGDKQITIFKTDVVYIESGKDNPLEESDIDIYWIIDRKRNEIRVVRSKEIKTIKLITSGNESSDDCEFIQQKYITTHPEMKDQVIEFFIQQSTDVLQFVKLSLKEKQGTSFYICTDRKWVDAWMNCNSLND